MSFVVYALVKSDHHANKILKSLQEVAGFKLDDISLLIPDRESSHSFAHEKHTKGPEGAVAGGASVGLVGGALGWMAGIGMLTFPGLGPFLAIGPIFSALSWAAVGATVGGVTGGLIGFGIPEYEAKRYEGKLSEGRILISVHADNMTWCDRAKKILIAEHAEDIGVNRAAKIQTSAPAGKKITTVVIRRKQC